MSCIKIILYSLKYRFSYANHRILCNCEEKQKKILPKILIMTTLYACKYRITRKTPFSLAIGV